MGFANLPLFTRSLIIIPTIIISCILIIFGASVNSGGTITLLVFGSVGLLTGVGMIVTSLMGSAGSNSNTFMGMKTITRRNKSRRA